MTSQPAPTAANVEVIPATERAETSGAPPAVALPLVADQLIDGKYRLLHQIGHGGMGSVWEAQHEALGRRVAVKFLKPLHQGDESLQSLFASEARMVAAIKHRFVVDVFDFGITEAGLYFMVLELLDGKTLAERMDAGPPLRAREAIQLINDCLRGLHAVHETGIVHRDLKPENIFVISDADGMFPKLIDFGISKRDAPPAADSGEPRKRQSRRTQPGMVVGTLAYMSPEQLRGRHEVDRRADVYSVGVILYELLVGNVPYDHDNVADLMVAIVNTGAPPLSRSRPDLGRDLSNIIARALAADPEARFPTALALRDALQAVLPGISAEAQTGAAAGAGKTGRGHETELQLAAAAAAFGESSGGIWNERRKLWIGVSIAVVVLIGAAIALATRSSVPVADAPRGGVMPSATPAPVAAPEPAAAAAATSTPAAPARAQPTAAGPSELGPAPAPVARKPRTPAARPAAKDVRSSKDAKARNHGGAKATKKLYHELDF